MNKFFQLLQNFKKGIWIYFVINAACLGIIFSALYFSNLLPAVNQDEFLPLLPLSFLTKDEDFRSNLNGPYSREIMGQKVPVLAYPYVGSVKGLLYYITGLPVNIGLYRLFNTMLLWLLFSLTCLLAFRLSDGRLYAALLCLILLFSDVPLIILGITDEGPILLNLILGLVYLHLCCLNKKISLLMIVPVALIVFLGVWDRLNFLWFIASGLTAVFVMAVLVRGLKIVKHALVVIFGSLTGLLGIQFFIPQYITMAYQGVTQSIPFSDFIQLLSHGNLMLNMLNPFLAYHRYVNVNNIPAPVFYRIYEIIFILIILFIGSTGLVKAFQFFKQKDVKAFGIVFCAISLIVLIACIVKTTEAWSSHHSIFIKPLTYVSLAAIASSHTGKQQNSFFKIGVFLVAGFFLIAGLKGYTDMRKAPQTTGIYDVSWNSIEAVKEAIKSDVRTVYALDWGVFYPGVVMSRKNQRWDMAEVKSLDGFDELPSASQGMNFGILFKISPEKNCLTDGDLTESIEVISSKIFNKNPGESWAFFVLNTKAKMEKEALNYKYNPGYSFSNIIKNGSFEKDGSYWRYDKYESIPLCAELSFKEDLPQKNRAAVLSHSHDADSRIIQEVVFKANIIYEVTVFARTQCVGETTKGAHLCLMDRPIESRELKGDTDRQRLIFYVLNKTQFDIKANVAGRLGTYGSMNMGKAWFTDFSVKPSKRENRDIPLFIIEE